MTDGFMSFIPSPSHLPEKPPVLINEAAIPEQPDPVVHTADEIHAVDATFAHEQKFAAAVSFYALWSGAMLLGDMAREHLQRADEDEEEEVPEELPRKD